MINESNEHQLDLDTPSQTTSGLQQNSPHLEGAVKKYSLKTETIYKLVDHSVGAIALECGYHIAHQCSLDILNDVCCDYLKRIATLLRTACDTEECRDSESDFVDSLERVFHQMSIPSAANLHQFICKMQAIRRHQYKQAQQQQNLDANNSSTSAFT